MHVEMWVSGYDDHRDASRALGAKENAKPRPQVAEAEGYLMRTRSPFHLPPAVGFSSADRPKHSTYVSDQLITITIGFFADDTPGGIFIGSTRPEDIASVARDAAVLLSLALQHGVPPNIIRHAVTRGASEEPASILARSSTHCLKRGSLPMRPVVDSVPLSQSQRQDRA